MSPYEVIVGPIVTEKAEAGRAEAGTLCFRVHPKATKTDIKNAIHSIFQLDVAGVRTARYKGKMRRMGRYQGRRPDWKKAYVKLAPGEKVPEYTQG